MSHPKGNKARFTEADRLQKIREHNEHIAQKRAARQAEQKPISIKRVSV